MNKIIYFLSLLTSLSTLALEQSRFEDLKTKLVSFQKSATWNDGFLKVNRFKGAQDKMVGFGVYQKGAGEKGALVISVGRTESAFKYYQFAEDLTKAGYSPIYVIEHRGQGQSERLITSSDAGTVEDFNNYVKDMNLFLTQFVQPQVGSKKLFLFAHSMGGGIAGSYLTQHSDIFTAAVFSSPMFQVKLPLDERIVLAGLESTCNAVTDFFGVCDHYIPEGHAYQTNLTFAENKTTSDQNQFELEMFENNLWPQIRLGSPTKRWLKETIIATKKLRDHAEQITTPILILQAEKDEYVDNQGQNEVCEKSKNCQIIRYLGSKHETFVENESIRTRAMADMIHFFDQH